MNQRESQLMINLNALKNKKKCPLSEVLNVAMLQSFKDYCYHFYSVQQKAAWGKINLQGYVIQMLEDVLAALRVVPFLLTALKYLHKLVSFSVSFHFRLVFVCFLDFNII